MTLLGTLFQTISAGSKPISTGRKHKLTAGRKHKLTASRQHYKRLKYLHAAFNGETPFDLWSLQVTEFEKIITTFEAVFLKGVFFDQPKNPIFIFQRDQAIHTIWMYMNFSLYCHYYRDDFPFNFQTIINLDIRGSVFIADAIRRLNNLSNEAFKEHSSQYRSYQELLQINACLFTYWHIISNTLTNKATTLVLFPLQLDASKLEICRKFANGRDGKKIPERQINSIKAKIAQHLREQFKLYPSPFKPSPMGDILCPAENYHLHPKNGMAQDFPLSFPDWSIEIGGKSHYVQPNLKLGVKSIPHFSLKHVWKDTVFGGEGNVSLFMDTHRWGNNSALIARTLQFPQVNEFALEFSKLMKLRAFIRSKMVYAQQMFESDMKDFCREHNKPFYMMMNSLRNNSPNEIQQFTNNQHLLAFHELFQLDGAIQKWVNKKCLQQLMHPSMLQSHPFFKDLNAEIVNNKMELLWEKGSQTIEAYDQSLSPLEEHQHTFLREVLPTSEIQVCIQECHEKLLEMAYSYPGLYDGEFLEVVLANPPVSEVPLTPVALTPQKTFMSSEPACPYTRLSALMQRLQISETQRQQIEKFLSQTESSIPLTQPSSSQTTSSLPLTQLSRRQLR